MSSKPSRPTEPNVVQLSQNFVPSRSASPVHVDTEHMVASLPLPAYVCDPEGRITFFNAAAIMLWGRVPKAGEEQCCGAHRACWPNGAEIPPADSPVAVTLRTGTPPEAEEMIIERPDGSRRFVLSHPRPLYGADGRMAGVINVLEDITERRQNHGVHERLAAIEDSCQDAVIGKDLRSIITSWSPAAERIFGYAAEEAIGQSILMLIPPDRREEERHILGRIMSGQRIEHFDTTRLRKDGSPVEVDITVVPVRDQNGRIVGASKIARDLTVQKQQAMREKLLATIVESTDDAIISKDLHGTIISWNRGAQKIFGYAPEEAVGQSIMMLIPDERKHEEREINARLIQGRNIEHFQTRRLTKDGRLLDVLLTISPLRDDSGNIVGASSVARDITEARQQALAQKMLAAIVESSEDAIVSKDLDGVITSWNRGAENVFGYTAEEALGRGMAMLLPEDRRDEEREILARLLQGHRIENLQTRRRAKDGRTVEVNISVSPLRDDTGAIVGAAAIVRDLTGSREQALTQKLLASIVESSDDAIISKDLNGIITSWNRGAEVIFGYKPEEIIGKSIMTLIPPERQEEEREIIARLLAGHRIDHFQTRRRRKNGELLDVSLTVSPIRDSSGAIVGASKVARDVTDQRRAQELLLRAKEELEQRVVERTEALRALAIELSTTEQRERKRLAKALHDDIQQLLVAVKIHTSFIPAMPETEAAKDDVMRLADEAIAACRALVLGLTPPLISDTNLDTALAWLARHMQEKYGLTVEVVRADCATELPEALRMLVFEIARELLFNVVKHAGVHSAQVSLECCESTVWLSVSDKGSGCDAATLQNLGQGSFGLFSIRERLTGLGGTFAVDSAPGEGCKVSITLPVKSLI